MVCTATSENCTGWEYKNKVLYCPSFPNCPIVYYYYERICNGVKEYIPEKIDITRDLWNPDCYNLWRYLIPITVTLAWDYSQLGTKSEEIMDCLTRSFLKTELLDEPPSMDLFCPNGRTVKVIEPACKSRCAQIYKSGTNPTSPGPMQMIVQNVKCQNYCCSKTYKSCIQWNAMTQSYTHKLEFEYYTYNGPNDCVSELPNSYCDLGLQWHITLKDLSFNCRFGCNEDNLSYDETPESPKPINRIIPNNSKKILSKQNALYIIDDIISPNCKISIFNSNGASVLESNYEDVVNNSGIINLSILQTGIYQIVIKSADKTIVKQILITE